MKKSDLNACFDGKYAKAVGSSRSTRQDPAQRSILICKSPAPLRWTSVKPGHRLLARLAPRRVLPQLLFNGSTLCLDHSVVYIGRHHACRQSLFWANHDLKPSITTLFCVPLFFLLSFSALSLIKVKKPQVCIAVDAGITYCFEC